MSQKEELNVADLESNNVVEGKELKAKKAKKEVTAEDIAYLEAGVAKITELGILSEEASRFLALVPMWHDSEVSAPIKESVKALFATETSDGTTEVRDFATEAFKVEIEDLKAMDKVLSRLNLIRAFYQRREVKEGATRKSTSKKTKQISIDSVFYDVNEAFLTSLSKDLTRDEKVAAIMEHPQTKKSEVVEAL